MNAEIFFYKIRKNINKLIDRIIYRYKLSFLFKPIKTELLILDDFFPCPLSNFRLVEFNAYLHKYSTVALTTGRSLSRVNEYKSIGRFIKVHPYKKQIKIFREQKIISAKLAIIIFQHNIEAFLDYLEKNEIPFIFTLYPGGNFKLNDKQSNFSLKRIFSSDFFRKVIVTQKITYDYLIGNHLCNPESIEFVYGCPMEAGSRPVIDKCFGEKGGCIDICFVAAKYHPTGMDKGYDIFIETAKELIRRSENYRFHVVGGFNQNDINVEDIKEYIHFYGYMQIERLRNFYESMDIILSPNRSNILGEGAFDGFPTAAVVEAGLKGVVMMLSDDNNQNIYLKNSVDCVFVNHEVSDISDKIEELSNNPDLMTLISISGRNKLNELFSYNSQIIRRFEIIDSLM